MCAGDPKLHVSRNELGRTHVLTPARPRETVKKTSGLRNSQIDVNLVVVPGKTDRPAPALDYQLPRTGSVRGRVRGSARGLPIRNSALPRRPYRLATFRRARAIRRALRCADLRRGTWG